jgi:hypothetical protein
MRQPNIEQRLARLIELKALSLMRQIERSLFCLATASLAIPRLV